ncbi:MAG: hypothetical protein V8R46_05255 [Eubacterium ramulus]
MTLQNRTAFISSHRKANPQKSAAPNNNRFINFQQRDNDYEALQKQLLQKSLLNKKTQS